MTALWAGVLAFGGIGPWTRGDNVPFYASDKFIGLMTFVIAILGMIIGSLLFPDKEKKSEASP